MDKGWGRVGVQDISEAIWKNVMWMRVSVCESECLAMNANGNGCNVVASGLPRAVKYLKDTQRGLQPTRGRKRGDGEGEEVVTCMRVRRQQQQQQHKQQHDTFLMQQKMPSVNLNSRTLDAAQKGTAERGREREGESSSKWVRKSAG